MAAPTFSNPLFNAAPAQPGHSLFTSAGAGSTPSGATNPYMGALFQSTPMASAPAQNVIQPTTAPQPTLTPQQQIALYMKQGHK